MISPMNYFLAILTGAVQGLTEFLPVSSTGHLIILENFANISQKEFGLAFDASLHLGTLVAIILFFYKDYINMLTQKKDMLIKIIVATIPAAVFGLMFQDVIDSTFRATTLVAVAMILFSFVIILAEVMGKKTKKPANLKLTDAFIIGLSQSIALIPGVSRSGATISAGLFLGLNREEAAKFAFLLSGPIIAGAGGVKFLHVAFSHPDIPERGFFLIGMVFSAIFGYLTIKYFLKYLSSHNLYPFIAYRIIFGLLLLILTL